MSWFRPDNGTSRLDSLGRSVGELRSALDQLRLLVLEQDTTIKLLQNERTLREAEIMDLRTTLQGAIKRVQGRLSREERTDSDMDSAGDLIRFKRR